MNPILAILSISALKYDGSWQWDSWRDVGIDMEGWYFELDQPVRTNWLNPNRKPKKCFKTKAYRRACY